MNHAFYLWAAYAAATLCMIVEAIVLHRRRINALRRMNNMQEDDE